MGERDWALSDVQAVVTGALGLHGHLLAAGEVVLARRIQALDGEPGRLWARLVGRKRGAWRVRALEVAGVTDVPGALARLAGLDLVHVSVPQDQRLVCYTVVELEAACRRLGLPRGGRRAELEARLRGGPTWSEEPVIRVAGGGLLRRLETLCFQDRWQDRSVWVLERLGHVRWAPYEPTGGPGAFSTRAALLRWSRPIPADTPPEDLLEALRALEPGPSWRRRLSARRRYERRLVEACRVLERQGEVARATSLYQALLEAGATHAGEVAARLALALEASGRPREAVAACRRWRHEARPVPRRALDRTGRRLARRGRGRWPPETPLRRPRERRLRLERAPGSGPRPLWGDPPVPVEPAVARQLQRPVLLGENALWTTLFGLILQELYWLPVPGMLPTAQMAGPLDLGTPDFAGHRREALEALLAAVVAGEGPGRLRASWALDGARLRGVAWELTSLEVLERVAEGLGGAALAAVLRRLAEEGWSAAVGLPDLAILPGPAERLANAFPARLPEGLLLVEVKGPSDSVRDAQAIWFDRLLAAGAPVELWHVVAR